MGHIPETKLHFIIIKKKFETIFSCESGPRDSNSFDREEPEPEPESFIEEQCPLPLREAVPVRSGQAVGLQDQNTDWFHFGSKIPKSVVCGLEVVQ